MLAIVSYILSVALAGTPDTKLFIENCQFGEVYAFAIAPCEIALTNIGDTPIRIFDIKPATIGDSLEPRQLTLAPHTKAYLHAKLNIGNAVATAHYNFHFRTDERGLEERVGNMSGFIMSVLDQIKPELDFGAVELSDELPQKSIQLSSHEAANFKISKILEKPDDLDVDIASDGRTLMARFRSKATWGLHVDYIKLSIDTPQQKQAWVAIKADVHGAVVPDSNPFDMGLMRFGNNNDFLIRVTSRSGKDFKTGKLELENIKGDTKFLPCAPKTSGCQMIALKVSDQQPPGTIKGKIWLELPDFQQRMPIAVWGLILEKNVEVRSLDQNPTAPTDVNGKSTGLPISQGNLPFDLHEAIKSNLVQQAKNVSPSGVGPLLKWTVANGKSLYGFQVFRSNSETGSFILVNAPTILANSAGNEPYSYQWRDTAAESGKTYWYYIGLINKNGTKQQLSGPQKIVAN